MRQHLIKKRVFPEKLITSRLQSYQLRLQSVASYDGFDIPVHTIGQGTPVLMLHAFGMDARQFLPFISPLLDKFCFYLPHLRGWGLSASTVSSEFNFIEQYARDVDHLLTHICHKHDVESVDVIAISMGALVMWAYFNNCADHAKSGANQNENGVNNCAHDQVNNQLNTHINSQINKPFSNKVRRYLNIDQSPVVHHQPDWHGGVFGDKQDEVFERFASVLQATLPYIQEANIKDFSHLPYRIKRQITEMEKAFSLMSVDKPHSRWFVNTSSYQPPHKLALHQHKTWRQKLHGLQAYLELPFDYREALPNTHNPVMMLIGGQSKLYSPKWQREVAKRLPNSEVIEIAHAGHAVPLDAPIAFTKALKQFLTPDA